MGGRLCTTWRLLELLFASTMPSLNRRAARRLGTAVSLADTIAQAAQSEATQSSSQNQCQPVVPPSQYGLRDPSTLVKKRQPGAPKIRPGLRQEPDVVLARGAHYVQLPHLAWLDPSNREFQPHGEPSSMFDYFGFDASAGLENDTHCAILARTTVSHHQRKKANQWRTWTHTTIPSLVQPYLNLLHATQTLREQVPILETVSCPCGNCTDSLVVMCVSWQGRSPSNLRLLIASHGRYSIAHHPCRLLFLQTSSDPPTRARPIRCSPCSTFASGGHQYAGVHIRAHYAQCTQQHGMVSNFE
jgi:hypothetical protein